MARLRMSNIPIATKEEARYFTPRSLERLPISMHDWNRLKLLSEGTPEGKNWAGFVRSLSLGVFASALLNIFQLNVLRPAAGYSTWVWVAAFVLVVGSAIASGFAQALSASYARTATIPMKAIADELVRIEGTFDPPDAVGDTAAKADVGLNLAPDSGVKPKPGGTFAVGVPAHSSKPAGAFAVGDIVEHKAFGKGVVTKTAGDALEIKFERTGETKKLLVGYAPIVKLAPKR